MKFGPIDFTQPSTWRGIAGFAALFGIAASPELTNAICIALGAVLSAIEIGRNEYATPKGPPIEMQSLPAAVPAAADQLRPPMPTEFDPTEDLPPPPGFSDR